MGLLNVNSDKGRVSMETGLVTDGGECGVKVNTYVH